jgi:hypothetical protein
MWPPSSWTRSVVSYIAAYDSNHLIIDGTSRSSSPHLASDSAGTDVVRRSFPGTNGFYNCESERPIAGGTTDPKLTSALQIPPKRGPRACKYPVSTSSPTTA